MTRFLRTIACVVVLLFGGTPVATLACQWSCATESGHLHASHHMHRTDGQDGSGDSTALGVRGSGPSTCDHAVTSAPGLISVALKVTAPHAIVIPLDYIGAAARSTSPDAPDAPTSPPPPRSAPLALRV